MGTKSSSVLNISLHAVLALAAVGVSAFLLTTSNPQLALLPALGIAMLLLFGIHPQIPFYLIIFSIPFFDWRTLSPQYPFLKVDFLLAGGLMVLLVPIFLIRKRFPSVLKANINSWMLIFFIVNVIAALLSRFPMTSLDGIRLLVFSYVFIALNLLFLSSKGFRHYLPWVLIGSVTMAALFTTIGWAFQLPAFTSELGAFRRGSGPTIGANNMALMCVYALPFLVHMLFYGERPYVKPLALLLIGADFMGVVATFSRGGFLNLIFVLGLTLIAYRRQFSPRYLGVMLAVLGLFAMFVIAAVPGHYLKRQATLMEGSEADSSLARRAGYLEVAYDAFKKNPIIGYGPETFRKLWVESLTARRFKMEERPAHNTYIEVLIGSGLVGLLAFGGLIVQVILNFTRARRMALKQGNFELMSIIGAYRLAFVSILIYFLAKSGLNHKFFLLSIAASVTAMRVVTGEQEHTLDGEIPGCHG